MPNMPYPFADASDEDPKARFARVVRERREQVGWNQDRLAEEAGVSRPTVQRIETAKTGTPNPQTSRQIFHALGLDPRLIPVVLGYVTAEEAGLPPEAPRVFDPTTEEIVELLGDADVPAAVKKEALHFLQFRLQQDDDDRAPRAG